MQDTQKRNNEVPIEQKLALTKYEAAKYSNIGINKIEAELASPTARLFCMLDKTSGLSNVRNLRSSSVQVL